MSHFTVADLFSGGGGMSSGFRRHSSFRVVAAADAQLGKPSSPRGSLGCNETYAANIGIQPCQLDLGEVSPQELRRNLGLAPEELDVLLACPPCTGFSRTNAKNHVRDDPRNSLVARVGDFVEELRPRILWLENARELIRGRFSHHLEALVAKLDELGYSVEASVHMLTAFGLPQKRERALLVAVAPGIPLRTMSDLWDGFTVRDEALTVRRTIGHLPPVEAGQEFSLDSMHVAPSMNDLSLARLRATPHDGGSWSDLATDDRLRHLLTPAQLRSAESGDWGSHPDVYGRMWWDRPSVTIKRECAHIGNGRYAHPEQDRLCTVRELGLLNGFPDDYIFAGSSLANMYRHIGDAVPPLISHQFAWLSAWMLGERRPLPCDVVLPGTQLRPDDIATRPAVQPRLTADTAQVASAA